ncbi:acid-sensing ion channel 1 isoform X1 [Coturnix japonica]|uniref:acid-sensing ion channel 1 isoform X1 n=1 Tax=Coturnix japonica TaxID=93934 RepID=UPI0013A5E776|nr:acid-sensing ion channel 1 isoform X1 [Coturnix japonica]XP_032296977.1 acid-sensing ion channel 1 isoform X1 [Coturnix japonica]
MMDLKVDEEEVDSGQPVSIQAFASSSTLHGISHIFSYERLSLKRVVWALCFMGSLALLALVCTNRIQYYFLYPHVTKLDEVAATRLTFPAVTFCNLNEFRFSRVTKNDLYHAGELLALLNNRYEIPDTQTADEKQLEILQDKANFRNFKPKPFNMLEFYDRAGHDIREMLLSCFFRGEQCSPEDFKVVFTRYGKCYTFNAGQDGKPRLITMKGGTGNGLEIMLDIQQDEYLPVWGETDETSFEAGIKVQIHSQDEPPYIDQLGFGVAPGFQTFVSCQEQRLIYLPPPWGDCKATTGDSEFYDTYSITACRIDCETRYLVENCNCRMVHMPGDAPYCTPEQYKECADPALDFLVEKDNEYCVCEMPCNVTRYGKELSMVKIPSKASAKYLAKKYNKSEQYIGENILVLDIFFEALNYETIEQKKAYEVAGLLGEHCGLVAVLRALVGTLQCGPMCCHPNPGAPGCAHSVGAEQSSPQSHSSDEVCPFSAPSASSALLIAFLSPPGDIGGQMGLFIGASILTVLELFDYAYEVIKHRLCRRGKCRKNHKRNNTDKGVALSMDDVKRHNPCESLRGHPAGMTYAANILPHHPARGTFEDFTC